MPILKEASVAVTGQIMDIETLTNYETKKYDGQRVVIATGDGFASVKVSAEDASSLPLVFFQKVAWLVRYGAWGPQNGDARTTCRYIREVTADDLDKLNSASIPVPATSGSASK